MSDSTTLAPPKKDGRGLASKYTDELAERIAREHGNGLSFESIAQLPWAPTATTMYNWQEAGRGIFLEALARARKSKAWHHAHQPLALLEAADPAKAKDARLANVAVTRADKLSSHHRWLAERLDRNTWGERVELALSGAAKIAIGLLGAPLALGSKRLSRNEGDDTGPLELDPGEPVDVEWSDVDDEEA